MLHRSHGSSREMGVDLDQPAPVHRLESSSKLEEPQARQSTTVHHSYAWSSST